VSLKKSLELQYSRGVEEVYSVDDRNCSKPTCGLYIALKSLKQQAVACLLIPDPLDEDEEVVQGKDIPELCVRA
jgi:hypothetical protein